METIPASMRAAPGSVSQSYGACVRSHARLERLSGIVPDPTEVARLEALNELAWELRNDQAPRSHALATEARALAIALGHKLGQARAARTLAMTLHGDHVLPAVIQLAEEAK